MRVFITGGTGLIGRRLAQRLVERGDQPVILSRQADKARIKPDLRDCDVLQGDPMVAGGWESAVDGCDAVVNLVGQNIFAERWDSDVKRRLRDSRIHATENVVAAMSKSTQAPKVLVQASAIGMYGPCGDEELSETSPAGNDYMADLCRDWEDAARAAERFSTRVARVRIGVVLAKGEGALGVMVPIFRSGLGSPIGSGGSSFRPGTGQQWFSWIHQDDIVGILLLALDHSEANGPINGTAPQPARNADFARELARALRGWFWPPYVPIGPPDFVLRLVLGEVAQVITTGQRVLPNRALALGYSFRFPDVTSALSDLFRKPAQPSKSQPQEVSSHT